MSTEPNTVLLSNWPGSLGPPNIVDLDFMSVSVLSRDLATLNCGVKLGYSRIVYKDDRVKDHCCLVKEPFPILIPPGKRQSVRSALALHGYIFELTQSESVFTSSSIPVYPPHLADALMSSGIDEVICYNFGKKTPLFKNSRSLLKDMPFSVNAVGEDNLFDIAINVAFENIPVVEFTSVDRIRLRNLKKFPLFLCKSGGLKGTILADDYTVEFDIHNGLVHTLKDATDGRGWILPETTDDIKKFVSQLELLKNLAESKECRRPLSYLRIEFRVKSGTLEQAFEKIKPFSTPDFWLNNGVKFGEVPLNQYLLFVNSCHDVFRISNYKTVERAQKLRGDSKKAFALILNGIGWTSRVPQDLNASSDLFTDRCLLLARLFEPLGFREFGLKGSYLERGITEEADAVLMTRYVKIFFPNGGYKVNVVGPDLLPRIWDVSFAVGVPQENIPLALRLLVEAIRIDFKLNWSSIFFLQGPLDVPVLRFDFALNNAPTLEISLHVAVGGDDVLPISIFRDIQQPVQDTEPILTSAERSTTLDTLQETTRVLTNVSDSHVVDDVPGPFFPTGEPSVPVLQRAEMESTTQTLLGGLDSSPTDEHSHEELTDMRADTRLSAVPLPMQIVPSNLSGVVESHNHEAVNFDSEPSMNAENMVLAIDERRRSRAELNVIQSSHRRDDSSNLEFYSRFDPQAASRNFSNFFHAQRPADEGRRLENRLRPDLPMLGNGGKRSGQYNDGQPRAKRQIFTNEQNSEILKIAATVGEPANFSLLSVNTDRFWERAKIGTILEEHAANSIRQRLKRLREGK